MTKIALFGGSGQTGQAFLPLALEAGYAVKALARTPSKISQHHPQLQIIQGDVLHAEDVNQTIQGCDMVVSLFGHVKGSPELLQTKGTQLIAASMQKEGISRLISLSGGGLPFEKDEPKLVDKIIRWMMQTFAAKVLDDAKQHAEVLKTSKLDWTIIRGPRLTNQEAKGQYQVGWVGVNSGTSISRKDLAAFILKQLHDHRYVHQMPFVSY